MDIVIKREHYAALHDKHWTQKIELQEDEKRQEVTKTRTSPSLGGMSKMTGYIYQTKQPFSYRVGDIESSVIIGKNLETEIADFLRKLNPHSIAVITDTNVADIHGDRLRRILDNVVFAPQHWFSVEPGEKSKSLGTTNKILDDMLSLMTRDSVIISFGGGVVNNLAGTVSSLLFRGTRLVHIPTTFMAQADAAIGIKQAVNSASAKNAYGAYHTPLCVFNDISFMKTLSVDHWRSGLSESVKVGIARSPEFASELKEIIKKCPKFLNADIYHLLEETIYPKIAGLEQDPYEKNSLLFLEIGHTIGHAIESASNGSITHGVGIAMGMLLETRVAIKMGISSEHVYESLFELFTILSHPTSLPANVSADRIIECLLHDNRRVSTGPLFVFAVDIGKTITKSGVDLDLVKETILEFQK